MVNILREFKDELPAHVAGPASKWCVKDIILADTLQNISDLISNPELIKTPDLLKQAKRRLVFTHTVDNLKYVIKAFPLDSIEKKLQHKKYAYSEARNMLRAQRLGIPSPELFGLGYQKRHLLINYNALLMEYLPYSSMEKKLNDCGDILGRLSLLQAAYPLFRILYETGCNHIDFKPGSIHMDDAELKVIDFQYVIYVRQPSLMILAAQAGHFAWDVSVRNNWVTMEKMQKWFDGLLVYLGVSGDDEIWDIFHRTCARRYSIADRMNGIAGQS